MMALYLMHQCQVPTRVTVLRTAQDLSLVPPVFATITLRAHHSHRPSDGIHPTMDIHHLHLHIITTEVTPPLPPPSHLCHFPNLTLIHSPIPAALMTWMDTSPPLWQKAAQTCHSAQHRNGAGALGFLPLASWQDS